MSVPQRMAKRHLCECPNFTKEFKIIAYMYRKFVCAIFKLCFSHYLPKAFLDRYTDNSGAEFKLSEQQMADVNPVVDIRLTHGPDGMPIRNPEFAEALNQLEHGGSAEIQIQRGWGGTLTNGTLGHFTIRYQGTLTVTLDRDENPLWYFNGQMDFYDKWNFDPSSHRHETAEAKVRLANAILPGKAFEITSVRVNVQQGNVPGSFVDLENGVQLAIWSGGTPTAVRDRCSRLAKLVGYDF